MTARTGEKCPASGIWKVEGFPTTTAPIAKGNTMPFAIGAVVVGKPSTFQIPLAGHFSPVLAVILYMI